jgi:hypothetical protein
MTRIMLAAPMVIALYYPGCTPKVQPTIPADEPPLAELWQAPTDIASRDMLCGPWGGERAPNPDVTYTFVARKQQGTNPGLTVTDPDGREWHVKQPTHTDQGAEGPVEVALSRVLSAIGYHQPPVYYLPSLRVADAKGVHVEPGGRFRLTDKSIKHLGEWSWQQNPFVGKQAYNGLLVVLLMFNSSDLKNENNALYQVRGGSEVKHWYVVRDLGTALGETGRFAPQRSDPDIFNREPFITGVSGRFVQFNYRGWHQELFKQTITAEDVRWASDLLGQLTARQWSDAFRAGGFSPAVADRFIGRLQQKIAEGRQLAKTASAPELSSAPGAASR